MRHPITGKFKFSYLLLFTLSAVVFGGCVSTPEVKKEEKKVLVFPEPPDQPRYYYERTLRSSSDVKPQEDADSASFRELVTGETSTVSGVGFGKPFGIIARSGRVYVGDTVHRSVMMFDPARGVHKEIGQSDPGSLTKPMGMDIDKAGNIYVMGATKKKVMIFDNDGKYLRSVGEAEDFDRPSSVAVTPDGSRIFTVDTGSSRGKPEFHRIRVYEGASGDFLYSIGERGNTDGKFNLVRDATIGPDNRLYVLDSGNFRVQVFDQQGKFIKKFGDVGRRTGQFARPKGIAVDKNGKIYVSDSSHANFQIFNPDGELLMFIGTHGRSEENARYLLPSMIDVDEDGRIYMVDQGHRKVDVFRPAKIEANEGSLGLAFEALKALKPKEQ